MLNTCLVESPSFGAGAGFSPSFGSPAFLRQQCWVFEGAVYLESPIQSCCVPDPRQVTARSGGSLFLPSVSRLAWRDIIPFSHLTSRCLWRSGLDSQNG